MKTRRLMQAITGAALAAAVPGAALAQQVPLADPIPGPIPPSPVQVGLETVMTGLVSPVAGAVAPGDRTHL
jgi:hypothetical protein